MSAHTRHRDVNDGVRQHHADGGQRRGETVNRREQTVHQGVHDPPLVQHHVDGTREADQQPGVRHRPEPVHEGLRRAVHAQAPQEARDDAHGEEEAESWSNSQSRFWAPYT